MLSSIFAIVVIHIICIYNLSHIYIQKVQFCICNNHQSSCWISVPGADNRYLALCVLMTSEQKVNSMAEETGSRFLTVDETETSAFIDSMKNENTKRKTGYDVGIFKQWLSSVGELQNPEDIEVSELNMLLARFYLSVRTKLNQTR